jgi:peptidoglycan/LPS O-acetylase OafA/YrhL
LIAGAWSCWFFACYGLHCRYGFLDVRPGSWPLIGGYGLGALGSVLLLVAFLGVNSKLLPGWAIYLGRISFGLYVYHQFAIYVMRHLFISHSLPIFFLKNSLALGVTVLVAAISYRFFETPFLRMKKRHAVIESQPILGTDSLRSSSL